MAKSSVQYVCSECGWNGPKWYGRCPECGQWGTVEEFHEARPAAGSRTATPGRTSRTQSVTVANNARSAARPITEVGTESVERLGTGFSEFDRVLGGGVVPGSVTLIAGEPGIGKSTLLLQTAGNIARVVAGDSTFRGAGQWSAQQSGRAQGGTSNTVSTQGNTASTHANTVLYISGEESQAQVRLRASRINAVEPNLLLASTTDLSTVLGLIEQNKPALAIVDSAQTIVSQEVDGISGGSTQVREVASALIDTAKTLDIPVFLVGHVTKDGSIAGPRTLEHLVDVVCQFEGDRHTRLRLLRAVKNRYGPTDEVGCFELSDTGIVGLTDPSGLFLSQSQSAVPGSCVTVTLEGRRPLPTEIQALVAHTSAGSPRRTTVGVDHSRVAMILAVLQARLGIDTSDCDVYASTVGGARISEPAADLATAIGIVSAIRGTPTRNALIAFGEVGLTGEVRACTGVRRRIQEAARLGFKVAIIPAQGSEEAMGIDGITVLPISDLAGALRAAIH